MTCGPRAVRDTLVITTLTRSPGLKISARDCSRRGRERFRLTEIDDEVAALGALQPTR